MTNEYYNYLGYGVTDSNGVAHLEFDEDGDPLTHSYTGVGAGEIDVVASLDNPISQGSIVSGTYSLWDTLFHDEATDETGAKNNNWNNYSNRLTVTPSPDGTLLERADATGSGYYLTYNQTSSSFITFGTSFIAEFEIGTISSRGSCGLDLATGGSSTDHNKSFSALGIQANDSIKLVYDGSTIKVYRNGGTTPTEVSLELSSDVTFGFYVDRGNSFQYKNLKIYSN